jgi:hypothetical protein
MLPYDSPISLKDVKQSPDWPEWEKVINAKLEQLWGMKIWKLVKRLDSTIPIANKWLFIKKTNNTSQIEKFKACLVIKGCSQHSEYDYNETYSPVVQLETLHTILAMVPDYNLTIQQMDIKGVYLNGILKEDVYMKQLEGYRDRKDHICKLIKMLYRLKQAEHKWNMQFDEGIQLMGFLWLISDPCAYIRHYGKDFQIITVWVDNLLIFSSTEVGMHLTKSQIKNNWKATDLGEPSKIISIKITYTKDSISIAQK